MRGFADDERERIREELVETGRELLLLYGPKKTNVVDITEPVGIAKSTFYRFFDSKADLYLEIYRREIEEFTAQVRSELAVVDTTREGLELLFRMYAEWIEENAFIQRMIVQSDHRGLYQEVSEEKMEQVQREGLDEFQPIFETVRDRDGALPDDVDTVSILGLMSVIGLLVMHREEFEEYDPGYYERVRDLLIPALASGLVTES